MNHIIRDNPNDSRIIVEQLGDSKAEIKAAAQRRWHRETADVRATLVAAGESTLNRSHAHSSTYERRAEQLTVTREVIEHPQNHRYSDDMKAVAVTIEEN